MPKVKFKRKSTSEIEELEIDDGSLICNYETGNIFMDYQNSRIQIGGNGGNVVNEESNSTQNSYSCNFINKLTEITHLENMDVIKHADGRLEIFGFMDIPNITAHNGYEKDIVLPNAYKDLNYYCFATLKSGGSGWSFLNCRVVTKEKNKIKISIWNDADFETASSNLQYHLSGFWK